MSWNDLHGQESIAWRAPRTDNLLHIQDHLISIEFILKGKYHANLLSFQNPKMFATG